ncbi:MAG: 50S ribosomal protein L29 [Bacteroidales bacterium]|jgi:large subunit ribosomal protein L29|nr:50S ribosomal protein L29 [Bacteroidales bacterium]MBO5769056.1 50S ribosomal protein L29 [Bacteroidales bacterium]MBO5818693.1 50S ribosomal protein L29 [Bacteroidales bacterium]MBO5835471.1 50S ribosomal protein L29 [Bacteroidales bacterium]MBO5846354.1 50S ribosomal protein L29 [Bacteroidales bacterium]
MKIKEVRELTTKELLERIDAETARLSTLELQHSISPLDNPMQIKDTRRLIARLKTVVNERSNQEQAN